MISTFFVLNILAIESMEVCALYVEVVYSITIAKPLHDGSPIAGRPGY